MKIRISAVILVLLAIVWIPLMSDQASAQTPQQGQQQPRQPQPPTPPQPPAPQSPGQPAGVMQMPVLEPPGQPINVLVEVTITEERPGAPAAAKTVKMTVADGREGRIRSFAETSPQSPGQPRRVHPLEIDGTPRILDSGKIRLSISLNHSMVEPPSSGAEYQISLRDALSVIMDNGKPLVVAQSADPVSDLKVSVEVKATVMK